MDTQGVKEGSLEKVVLVKSNDPKNPNVFLTIRAEAEPELKIADQSIDFGTVKNGSRTSKETIVTLLRPIKITSWKSNDPNVNVSVIPIPGSNMKKFKFVFINTAVALGYHISEVVLKTSSRTLSEMHIPVRVFVIN